MIMNRDEFAKEYSRFIERLLIKELPEKQPSGEPFFEREYIEIAKVIVCNKLLHILDTLDVESQ